MTTQHTHAPNFGRKVDGCPRCDELKKGAAPVVWAISRRKEEEAARIREIHHHYRSGECSKTCGPVCTRFDW